MRVLPFREDDTVLLFCIPAKLKPSTTVLYVQ